MRVYPYRRLPGVVSLRVNAVELRGPGEIREPLDTSTFSAVEQVVAPGAAGRDDWESARLTLSATVPGRATDPDGPWSDVAVVAVLAEGATNTRTTICLEPRAEGGREWTGRLDLWRVDHLDRAMMSVHVVATVDGVPGRVIAASEKDWIIDLKADAPLRERELDVAEVGFREGPEWLRPFRDVPWIVDTSGDLPAVHVNTDFEGITDLVSGNGSPVDNLVRDLLIAQMCTDVWTAVFHTAIGDLEIEDDGTPIFPSTGGARSSARCSPTSFPVVRWRRRCARSTGEGPGHRGGPISSPGSTTPRLAGPTCPRPSPPRSVAWTDFTGGPTHDRQADSPA